MFRERELGFSDIWPSYWPRVRALMLRGFYDGSGKGEDQNSKAPFLTLAGIAAYDDLWADIDQRWRELLKKHQMSHIHMRDLGNLQKCFDGKQRHIAEYIVSQFVALISNLDPATYRAYGCTVNLDDFRRAQKDCEPLRNRQPADLCANWCIGDFDDMMVIYWGNDDRRRDGDDKFVVVFDHGEEFEGRMRRIWDTVKADESLLPANSWVDQVESIIPLDSKKTPGLQAADVLAWNCNRHYCAGDRDEWFNVAWKNWTEHQVYYDYDRMIAEYSTGAWRPPKRAEDHQ